MQKKAWARRITLLLLFVSSIVQAGIPLWTFTPLTPTSMTLHPGQRGVVAYTVTNQSNKPHTLTLQSIPGVTQISSGGTQLCENAFVLANKGSSCVLALLINQSLLTGSLNQGPVVCQQGATNQCYQPSFQDRLNVTASGQPVILSLTPNSGSAAGGTTVTITGTGLSRTRQVYFSANPATNVTIVSDTELTVTVPRYIYGIISADTPVNVFVITTVGLLTSPNGYTYLAPKITGVDPNVGSIAGGNSVTLTGSQLTDTTAVVFGSTSATITGSFSDNSVTVTAPAVSSAGPVNITLIAAAGITTCNACYTYQTGSISTIDPDTGSVNGSTGLTISGTGLSGIDTVTFYLPGTTTQVGGASVSSATATTVLATTTAYTGPSSSVPVPVDVYLSGGGNEATKLEGFTYIPVAATISPNNGTAEGYNTVSITRVSGGLSGTTDVTFGGNSAANVIVESDTTLTVVPPAGSGSVNVVTIGSVAPITTGLTYTYIAADML
jgi:large repetitive protein